MKVRVSIPVLLIYFFTSSAFEAFSQEHFLGWIDDESFLLHRNNNSNKEQIKVHLPGLQESKFKGTMPQRDSNARYIRLPGHQMVYQKYGDLYLVRADGSEEQLTSDTLLENNPTKSPDGSKIAYTKNRNLYIFDLPSGKEIQLTHDGSETLYNGWSSWVYYEEILRRSSRYKAFWWSPKSDFIAFLQFDDSKVPRFPIFHPEGRHGMLEWMHYPKSGDPPPAVRLGFVHTGNQMVTWAEEDTNKDQYTAWPFWTPDGQHILFQELNRDQDSLRIVKSNPFNGKSQTIYLETHPTWVKFFEEFHFLNDTEFVIRSNRHGWYNLYRCSTNGMEVKQLTNDPWSIQEVDHIDKEEGMIYYYASGDRNINRHYFQLNLTSQSVKRLTEGDGWHRVNLSPQGDYLFDKYSSLDHPIRERIVHVSSGNILYELQKSNYNANLTSGVEIKPFEIETEDDFLLPGYMVLPKGFDQNEKYPVVFTVYGGPNRPEVKNSYRDFSHDFYANNNIIQVKLDHRGCGLFGRRGLDYLHRSLGKWEIEDLISGVKWLRDLPYIDRDRIGITGGSYGGYVTCMALTYGADYFSHGVSLYPVVDWRLYDNVYTERYMDKPSDNPNGYMAGSALTHAHRYRGNLLLVHGGADENVHTQNTMQFISLMQDLGKQFELMIYPNERHGWGGAKRSHLNQLTHHFWKKEFGVSKESQVLRP